MAGRTTWTTAVQDAFPFEDLQEIATASPWCQRWRDGRHSWRHAAEGGFRARDFEVEPVSEQAAKAFVLRHHYSKSYPAAKVRLGLYRTARSAGERVLAGVAVFGVPVSRAVLTNPLPELEPYTESVECSRFVLLDETPGNSESWFLARCFEYLVAAGVRGVVSFADPVPRRDELGAVVATGHVGTIYQATNAAYTGRGTPRTLKLLPDGTELNERAAQKVRRQEPGHQYVEAKLISLGAPVPRAGVQPAVWLREALVAVGARNLRHRGPHRYVFRLGRTRRERNAIRLGVPEQSPYPKLSDPS